MIRIIFSLLLLATLHLTSHAQDKGADAMAASIKGAPCASVDALATYIKQDFTSDSARIRAIYVWITHHIKYDLARLRDMEKDSKTPPQPVADVLATRQAVCQGYSELFVALCKGAGINATVINGYTKKQGRITPIGHAWTAAEVDGQWFLFDPTWGAGYVQGEQFVQRFNNGFYKVPPSTMIIDHMPFDPMHQFLLHPITHKEFIEGKPGAPTALFQFSDSLKLHSQLSHLEQMSAELRRLEAAGVQIDLLQRRQVYLKTGLQFYASKDAFEEGGKAFSTALALYQEYIGHKNKQFTTITDPDLRKMVDSMGQFAKTARYLLSGTVPKTDQQRQAKTANMASIERFYVQLNKEKQFVEEYFTTDAARRKQLFTRR